MPTTVPPCCPPNDGHADDCTTRPAGAVEAPTEGHTDDIDITTHPVTHCDDAPRADPA